VKMYQCHPQALDFIRICGLLQVLLLCYECFLSHYCCDKLYRKSIFAIYFFSVNIHTKPQTFFWIFTGFWAVACKTVIIAIKIYMIIWLMNQQIFKYAIHLSPTVNLLFFYKLQYPILPHANRQSFSCCDNQCTKIVPIMLESCSMLLVTNMYYVTNYAGTGLKHVRARK